MSAVQTCEVAAGDDGIRLDRWFQRHFPQINHIQLQKLLRKGQVRLDGRRAKASDRIVAGQMVRVPPFEPKADARPAPQTQAKITAEDRAALEAMILWQDDDVMALNKPFGLAVQGGSKTSRHLDGMLPALAGRDGEVPRLVHRLDRDTSGVLLLGKSAAAAAALGKAFRERTARKEYWAVTCGPPPMPYQMRISAPLSKQGGMGRERVGLDEDEGKAALTWLSVIDNAHRRAAWVALWPKTGRTHQLRAHMALMERPILGDGKYGGRAARPDGFEQHRSLHLHARHLVMDHPLKARKTIDVTAPMPPHMAETFKFLGFDEKNPDARDPFDHPEFAE